MCTKNSKKGKIIISDGGFGIMQITPKYNKHPYTSKNMKESAYLTIRNQMWDWRANVRAGKDVFIEKKAMVTGHVRKMRLKYTTSKMLEMVNAYLKDQGQKPVTSLYLPSLSEIRVDLLNPGEPSNPYWKITTNGSFTAMQVDIVRGYNGFTPGFEFNVETVTYNKIQIPVVDVMNGIGVVRWKPFAGKWENPTYVREILSSQVP